ncbi:preprotein translocase subunit SecG [Candidatus Dependentiae bacterium]|nr:preprotein translocase subunit SecG [Candidatus Dependentiae bacterium]
MTTFLTILFVILSIFLALFILIQQGKGDMGLGGLGGGGQMLFGGSGGQDFFEKATWVMGALFIFGALGLTILKNKESTKSKLAGFVSTEQTKQSNNVPFENKQK